MGIEYSTMQVNIQTTTKNIARIILNGEKLEKFPLRSGTRQDAHFYCCYSTQYWKFSLELLGKKKKLKEINEHKPVAVAYTSNFMAEKEHKRTVSFKIM